MGKKSKKDKQDKAAQTPGAEATPDVVKTEHKKKKKKNKNRKKNDSHGESPTSQQASTSNGSMSSLLPPHPAQNGSTSASPIEQINNVSIPQPTAPLATSNTTTTLPTAAPTAASVSLDDMALQLFAAKESESEVERLQAIIKRLNKELEHKDAVISRLQDKVTSLLLSKGEAGGTLTTKSHDGATDSTALVPKITQPFRNPIKDVALQCSICVDYFASPFTVECGHTFCYTCLHSWLEIQKSCPTCRTKLLRRPTLSFNIQEQVQESLLHLPEADRSQAKEKLAADEKSVKSKQRHGDLWEGIFKPMGLDGFGGNTIVDREDGVRRCVSCGWEVRGGSCVNCRTLFSDAEEDSDQSQENSDQDSEQGPDEYDSHDSFIDDDGYGDGIMMDEDSDIDRGSDDLEFSSKSSSGDSDDGTSHRRTRSNIKNKNKDMTRKHSHKKVATIFLSSSDEDESDEDPAIETIESGSDEDDISPRHLSRNSKARKSSRRAILVSDEDEDEDAEEDQDSENLESGDSSSDGSDDDIEEVLKSRRRNIKTLISSEEEESSEDDDFVDPPRKKRRL